MGIRVAGVSKQFGPFRAIDDFSLDVETGSLVPRWERYPVNPWITTSSIPMIGCISLA
jgi:hypothetical protein